MKIRVVCMCLMLPMLSVSEAAKKPRIRVVVVGTGPAGASVARTLANTVSPNIEFEVTILEKSDRIGGKSLSLPVTLGRREEVTELGTQMNFEQLGKMLQAAPELKDLRLAKELAPAAQNLATLYEDSGIYRVQVVPRLIDPGNLGEVLRVGDSIAAGGIVSREDLALAAVATQHLREQWLRHLPFDNLGEIRHRFPGLEKMTADEFLRNFRVPLRPTFNRQDTLNPARIVGALGKYAAYVFGGSETRAHYGTETLVNWLYDQGYREAYFSETFIRNLIEAPEGIVEFSSLHNVDALNYLWQLKWVREGGAIVVARDGWQKIPQKLLQDFPRHRILFESEVTRIEANTSGSQIVTMLRGGKSQHIEADIVFITADSDDVLEMLPAKSPVLKRMLQANEYSSAAVLQMVINIDSAQIFGKRTSAMAAAPGIFQDIAGIMFHTGLKNKDLGGKEIVRFILKNEAARNVIEKAEKGNWADQRIQETLFEIVSSDLERVTPVAGDPSLSKLLSAMQKGKIDRHKLWPKALPMFKPGYAELVEEYLQEVKENLRTENRFSGTIVLGQYVFGRTVANTITRSVELTRSWVQAVNGRVLPRAEPLPSLPMERRKLQPCLDL